ncbi:MAG: PIN domain-containing protein [Acidobacteriota bacterium]|nr:PIN domain-containing protein [Acidobacteriota bacterium]
MILIDTSVWIRFLSNQAEWADLLDQLLLAGDVTGHELVYAELLIGDSGGRAKLLASYEKLHQSRTVPHKEVLGFVRSRKLYGRGMGWIDVHLLASAIVEGHKLWTADVRLAALATELKIAWR